ncbi:LVIVD repeat-containing protein [Lentimicrobium sp. S6]|uniref:LVIVD repeat-containing protein n=1 Tax=Lentimicrobium sp. S6 TaxID=2735872 RepID=UPI001555C820|nr:hypothetical protein [Lentimicrobium sp. S6]NPD45908.1 hypothetical protein [Lentimicrobium sp. S6]
MKNMFIIFVLAIAIMASCTKDSSTSSESGVPTGGDTQGQGGSMAKFSISGDHLFLINEYSLKVYDLTNTAEPQFLSQLNVDFGIETVFTLEEHLFIGSINGMYIYDISNPANIKYLSFYQHITSCDPVVANDTLAFVTLNSTSSCNWQSGVNRLDVLDIKNKEYPKLLSSQVLSGPKGLGLYQNYVFVCNSGDGVEIYDYTNPYSLVWAGGISGIDAYDVIIREDRMFLVGQDGLFQYDISDVHDIDLISNILFQ